MFLCFESMGCWRAVPFLMRILIVNYEYPPVGAGAATASEAIAKELAKLGHHAVVLTGRCKNLPAFSENLGISVCRIPSLRRSPDRASLLEMGSFWPLA